MLVGHSVNISEHQFMHKGAVQTERRLYVTVLRRRLWRPTRTVVHQGYALHATASSNEELLHAAQYQARLRCQTRGVTQDDTAGAPESGAADNGTPPSGPVLNLGESQTEN